MQTNAKLGTKIANVIIIFILILVSLTMIVPFLHLISVSISKPEYVYQGAVTISPKGLYFKVYEAILKNESFLKAFYNSIKYTAVGTAINLVLTCMCAYPLNKKFPGKKFFTLMLVLTMFISGGMIPNYLLMNYLGILDKIWVMVLPGAISAYYAFIMRTYFLTISEEIEEAAKIDGCSEIGILFKIILPLSKPIFATLGLFYGIGHWNNYFGPLIYLNSKENYPLQLFLRNILVQQSEISSIDRELFTKYRQQFNPTQFKYGTIIVSIIPVLLLYPYLQKHFTKGFMIGSVKG